MYIAKHYNLISHFTFQLEDKLVIDFSGMIDINQFLLYPQILCKSAGSPYIQRPRMFLDAAVSMWMSESNTEYCLIIMQFPSAIKGRQDKGITGNVVSMELVKYFKSS